MNAVRARLDGCARFVVGGRLRAAAARQLLCMAFGLMVLVGLAGAASSSALIAHVHGVAIGYEPPPETATQLPAMPFAQQPVTYHGGPVMPSNSNYTLYWDPSGAPSYPAGYEAGINRYFEDLAHDSGGVQNTDSVLTQYGDEAGQFANYSSHFAGALVDTDPYPANGCSAAPICLTDAQLRSEITKVVEANGLPADLEHEYFLLTPPGVESCFEAAGHACSDGTKHVSYCSYHEYIPLSSGVIIYANDPYVAGLSCDVGEEHPNNNPSDATLAGGLVHEHSGSVTDPELNAWYESKKQEEVGDKCRTFKASTEFGEPLGKAPDGANYNQVINGDLYLYQQEWSNAAEGCEQRTGTVLLAPTVTKLAPKSGSSAGGTVVKITGTNFASPATVKFGGVAATEASVNSSKSITAVSPAEVAGTVDVTVTTAGGTSATSKKDHFKYKKK